VKSTFTSRSHSFSHVHAVPCRDLSHLGPGPCLHMAAQHRSPAGAYFGYSERPKVSYRFVNGTWKSSCISVFKNTAHSAYIRALFQNEVNNQVYWHTTSGQLDLLQAHRDTSFLTGGTIVTTAGFRKGFCYTFKGVQRGVYLIEVWSCHHRAEPW